MCGLQLHAVAHASSPSHTHPVGTCPPFCFGQPPSEQPLTAGTGSLQSCRSFSRLCQVPVLSLHLCFLMPSELLLQGKTSTEQVLEVSYSLKLLGSGQERGPTMPGISEGTDLGFSHDGLHIWKPRKSYLAGFKGIWLSMTQRSMKDIPEHSV